MKRIIAILILLIATGAIGYTPPTDRMPALIGPPNAVARLIAPIVGGGVPPVVAGGCGAGTLINETYDTNPGTDLTWADTGTTPNPDSTGHSFTGGSGQVLYIAGDDENEAPLYQKYNHGSEVLVSYHRIKFNIAQHGFTTSGDFATLLTLLSPADVYIFRVKAVYVDADEYTLSLEIHGTESGTTTSGNLSVGTDYTLEFYWNRTAQTWAWKIDNVAIEASGTTDSTRGGWQYTIVGIDSSTSAARGVNVYYECYGVSTADWVGN